MTYEEALDILNRHLDKSLRNNLYQNTEKLDYEEALFKAIEAISIQLDMLQADVVQVVRCRDCRHGREQNAEEKVVTQLLPEILICNHPDVSEYCWQGVWPNHYCSYGERREEG